MTEKTIKELLDLGVKEEDILKSLIESGMDEEDAQLLIAIETGEMESDIVEGNGE